MFKAAPCSILRRILESRGTAGQVTRVCNGLQKYCRCTVPSQSHATHRILCGDARRGSLLERLVSGHKIMVKMGKFGRACDGARDDVYRDLRVTCTMHDRWVWLFADVRHCSLGPNMCCLGSGCEGIAYDIASRSLFFKTQCLSINVVKARKARQLSSSVPVRCHGHPSD